MDEMVERVAQALRDKHYELAVPDDLTPHPKMFYFRQMASAAIAAMREPTQPMIEACGADDFYDSFALRQSIWETMVDAALKE